MVPGPETGERNAVREDQLGIDAAELATIKAAPADEVVRCEECSRILVRTAESGL